MGVVSTLPVFRGKVYGASRVAYMMGFAPKEMSRAVFVGFLKTRDQFIGTSRSKGNKSGIVRRRIERRKNWGGRISPTQNSPTWTRQFSGLIKGRVEGNTELLQTLSLHMGVLYRTRRPVNAAMENMVEGARITAKGSMLVIPMYENLQRVGVFCKTGNSGLELKRYEARGSMFVLQRGTKTLFYDQDLWKHGDKQNALMFVGVRSVSIKKQFDFYSQWANFEKRAHKLIEAAMDRGIRRINGTADRRPYPGQGCGARTPRNQPYAMTHEISSPAPRILILSRARDRTSNTLGGSDMPEAIPTTIPATPSRTEQNEILKQHAGLIRKAARRYATTIEFDDCLQIARIAFVDALPKFDPGRGAFAGFAWYRMAARLHTAAASEQRRRADTSFDQPNAEGDPLLDTLRSPDPLPDEYTARREKAKRLRSAVDALPEAHRVVMMARFAGKTLEEAGALLSRTKARAQQVQVEAVGMLRAALVDGE